MNLYELAALYREEMLAREQRQSDELTDYYGEAWGRIKARLDWLLEQIEAAKGRGEAVTQSWLYQRERLQSLLGGVAQELGEFARFADVRIQQEQQAAISAALLHSEALTRAAVNAPASVAVNWNRMPQEAFRELVGFLSDGTPVRRLLDQLGPDSSAKARKALTSGVAAGRGPNAIATEIREALGGNLTRARTIARTETLRAYRESSIRSYAENGDVVERWRWTASLSVRTCAMCLAMDGKEFPVTTPFGSHPSCRCVAVPVARSLAEIVGDPSIPDVRPKRESGETWFSKLPEEKQAAILDPGKLELYRSGKLQLQDLVGYRQDAQWGPVRWEKPLKDVAPPG